MENKGKISINLGTAICLVIIVILVMALVGMWFYFNNKIKDNILETSKQDIIQKNNDETITNKEFVKNVSLNGNSHEISFKYNNTKTDERNDEICDEVEILFDKKVIKTFYNIYRPEKEKEEPELKVILGEDNKQYIIIIINTYSLTGTTNYFAFINEKGEVLGILNNYGDYDIIYNGKKLSYEINENNMKLYKQLNLSTYDHHSDGMEYNSYAAIEYGVKINENMLDVCPIRIYSNDEVQIAGAKY